MAFTALITSFVIEFLSGRFRDVEAILAMLSKLLQGCNGCGALTRGIRAGVF